ncbi:Uncharacterised protein [uncultured archaeon]|nr:Uncharacterised protein [uncultured archaeon]
MDKGDWGMHKKHHGLMMVILGVLVLINVYWPMVSWGMFIGWLLVLAGAVKWIMCMGKHKRR